MNRLFPRSVGIGVAGLLVLAACSVDTTPSPRGGAGGAPSPHGSADGTENPSRTPELSSELSVSASGWATDFSRHEVPLDEFLSGGPGKDGIPAIDEPKFQPIAEVDWLEDQEPVIAFGIGNEWRAYPIQILMWHEIVNDTVAGTPVAVTFCPLCHTAIVFDRTVDGTVLDFGVSGNLRHSDLVPKTVDVLGGLLSCVCGRYVRSDGFTGSGTRQRHHPEPCEAWGAKARRAARVWEEPISNQLASISLDDATIARITTALASPKKPVSDIDARRLERRKRELALAHADGRLSDEDYLARVAVRSTRAGGRATGPGRRCCPR